MSKKHNKYSGFTLIEVIVVIIIMGILATVAMRSLGTVFQSARTEETKQELKEIGYAIAGNPELANNGTRTDYGYVGDVGSFPPNLEALNQNPGGYATWKGPYIRSDFTQLTNDYKQDAWGTNYSYSGGVDITSTGSGSSLVHKIGNASTDFLINQVTGNVYDINGIPPGTAQADSLSIELTIPNGSGATVVKTAGLSAGGYFAFDSIPIGNHDIRIVYRPSDDTLERFVSVLPQSSLYGTFLLGSAFFSGSNFLREILRPNGIGSFSDLIVSACAQNWECVDESISDDDASYLAGFGVSYRTDTYALVDNSAGSGTIDSVVISMNCVGTEAGNMARTVLRTGGSLYEGATVNLTVVSVYTVYTTAYSTNPATSSAWTWTEVDNLEAGVTIKKEARCTQIWVEVFYTN